MLFGIIGYRIFPLKYINPELKPYYNNFMATAKQYCPEKDLNIPVKMDIDISDKVDAGILGYCVQYKHMFYYISINKSFWDQSPISDRYQVMMHELTHCVMGEGHSEDPDSYMYYSINYLTTEETEQQLTDFFNEKCNGGVFEPRKLFDSSLSSRESPGLL